MNIEALQQQLALKDELLESKNAVIASQAAQLALQRENAALSLGRVELQLAQETARRAAAGASARRPESEDQPAQQRRCACSTERSYAAAALETPVILNRILSYVGGKEWLYFGGVSRAWRGFYISTHYRVHAGKRADLYKTSTMSSLITASRFA
jgi:septal ring factor EnvC (AmiA/AmiB activator)